MKKFFITAIMLGILCSCQHDIVRITDFIVTPDSENTYHAGKPVRFNISGEVDNIIFYSGEESRPDGIVIKNMQNYLHEYEYTWESPGTYEVAFVGINSNYLDSSDETKYLTIIIIDNSDYFHKSLTL